MEYSIDEITSIIGARRHGDAPAKINWLLTDSRSLVFPENSLFFALKSDHGDGHRYISSLYERGVRNFVVESLPQEVGNYRDANFLQTENTRAALQRIGAHHRGLYQIPVVGITGSNGKTIVKEWLWQLLSADRVVTRSPRSYNSQIGVPLSVCLLDGRSEVGIFEAGISEVGEMAALERIVRPTIGVMTNIGEAHQEHFSSMEQKCREKFLLFQETGTLVYNADEEMTRHCAEGLSKSVKRIGWSMKDRDASLYIYNVKKTVEDTSFSYVFMGQASQDVSIPFTSEASLSCAIHCLAVCLHMGLGSCEIAERMARLEPVAMRLEVKEGINGCTLISDTYNSDVKSLEIALDFMNRRQKGKEKRKVLILSDMLQTGRDLAGLYAEIALIVNNAGIDLLVAVGKDIGHYVELFRMETQCFQSVDELLRSEMLSRLHHAAILCKGARMFRFDRIIAHLSLKENETTLSINLSALIDNLNYYRNMLRPDTRMVCMVKASAYGAGALEVAKTLQDQGAHFLAVAVADEGATLRRRGITGNVMVMNPEKSAFRDLFEYGLEPEVYSFRLLEELVRAAEQEGVSNFPIHLKLDTGMHRLGFHPVEDVPRLIRYLKGQSALVVRSVFSHFVGSDGDFNAFTEQQFRVFNEASQKIAAAFPYPILRHICNTAGIERFPQYHLDMVRLGLGLYGIDPHSNRMLRNVSTLRTTILQIHDVPAGDSVGYSRKEYLKRDSRIAALPIGYADGLDRHLGNGKGYCLVNGRKAHYVGNICMDVCMIDVTEIDCEEGDEAIIFGDELPVTVLSDLLGTIPYEILTSVSERVKRIYFQD
ncbi:MAG: bifunctional UDP-N-acetylmuramoyl-tripeptide:D-alanyl-D-alanine ligase/alanine racemase [Bacteroidaceae bacterium]|nr:bifunctional UDP-N-acetylmuramoyl-tripeptide:D-alanyl-D-alanine ligase/alanine racemase [Bacteroidaceae bacterium]